MLNWLFRRPEARRRAASRILEGVRELGVLWIAFAPLDLAIAATPVSSRGGLFFAGLGRFLFLAAVAIEGRPGDA